ncbi:MAG: hypothetical protein HQL65_13920 [Magnetococcales bacterium]|nr:hypothetical protein [Magnetococcales bacterium]
MKDFVGASPQTPPGGRAQPFLLDLHPSFSDVFHLPVSQAGSATHRALAALTGGGILLGWLLLVRLIAVTDHPGAEGIAQFSLLGVTVLCLGSAWLLYRLIRHLDPEDDMRNPGWPDLFALWLLELYERIFPQKPVYSDRVRTRNYVHAAHRGFHSVLSESIVELERQPASFAADPEAPATPAADTADTAHSPPAIPAASAMAHSPMPVSPARRATAATLDTPAVPAMTNPAFSAPAIPDGAEESPVLFDNDRQGTIPPPRGSMRLRRRQAVSQGRSDAPAKIPDPAGTGTSNPTDRKS